MVEATFNFPTGFLWGTATAAHQVEGNNKNNNWALWEQDPAHIREGAKAGLACDWWSGRWREDFDRAAETGQNTHRLSVEWSRIQPAPGVWDEGALDIYRQMVRGLRERGMEPMVTLHHFTDPLWLYEQGGWENDISAEFSKYAQKVVDALKEYVSMWCTLNEPNLYAANGYLLGDFPPGKKDIGLSFKVMENLVRGHAAAYETIHRIQPGAQVGIASHYRGIRPHHSGSPLDRWVVGTISKMVNAFFFEAFSSGDMHFLVGKKHLAAARNTQDFIGINYYSTEYIAFNLLNPGQLFSRRSYNPDAELSPNGYIALEPEGFFHALEWALRFKRPIIVTENGVEDPDDRFRPRYLAEHIHQMWRAVNFNYPIRGYYHWSLVDNFEWERGWTQRFGLWELDLATQGRRKRPSADFFSEICHTNSLSSEMVARYAPGSLSKLFPEF